MNQPEKLLFPRVLLSTLILLFPLEIPALPDSPAAISRPTPPEQTSAVPVSKITRKAEAIDDWLSALEKTVLEAEWNIQVAETLLGIEKTIHANQKLLETTLNRHRSHERLQSLRSKWQSTREQIQEQLGLLEKQVTEYEKAFEEIDKQTKIWGKTVGRARKESAPRAIIDTTNGILKKLKNYNIQLKKIRNDALNQQNQAAELQNSVDQTLAGLKSAQKEIQSGLFTRQDVPVWRIKRNVTDLKNQLTGAKTVFPELLTDALKYVEFHFDRIINHLLLILVFGWFLSRRRSVLNQKNGAEEESNNTALAALQYPWAAAVLFGVLLASFVFPDRVLGFKILIAMIGVPVWLRVVSGMLPAPLLGPLVVIAFIAFADLLRTALGAFGLLNRVLLTLIFTSGLFTVVWLRQIRWTLLIRRNSLESLWVGLFSAWIRLSQTAAIIGLPAILLGYTLLADRLVSLAIWGSILATAFLASIRLFESVIQSMVDEHLFDRIRMIRANSRSFMKVIRVSLRWIGFCSWFYLVTRAMQFWEPFREWGFKLFATELGREPVTFSIGDILAFVLTLWMTWLLARFLTFALDQEIFSRIRVGAGVPFAITTFTRYAILVIGFLAAVGMLGFPLDKITLLLSALGVGIGFGLQNITNNFISGIILLFERPIRVGDKVQLDDLVGIVASIGIRASKLRGFDGADVIVPNGDFISARVINWTLADQQRRIILPVPIAYGTEPEQVIEILNQIAADNPEILRTPAPESLFRGFGNGSLEFELRAWTESDQGWMAVMSDLALATHRALRDAGIKIPLPQRDLTVSNFPELANALAKAVPVEHSHKSDPAQP